MTSVEIGKLFDNDRMPGGLEMVPLIFYFPLGVVLALIRFFIGFHAFVAACILPKMSHLRCLVLRSMCAVLGIFVSQEGTENRDKRVKVFVANYTSTLDHLAFDLIMPSIMPCVWDLPPTLMWILGYADLGAKQGREVLIQNAKKHTSESEVPMLVFPEGASTNGKAGLLKFSLWPFSLGQPIHPVVFKISRPLFARIAPSVLGGRWWLDVFWFLFVPYTHFSVKLLTPLSQGDNELTDEFTRRAQEVIAKELGVACTVYTSADKVEYAKRVLFIQPAPSESTSAHGTYPRSHPLDVMTAQVKDVLPDVPVHAIRRDLALTKDVDLTITNILEGRVTYEDPAASTSSATSHQPQQDHHKPQPPKADTAAKSFAKASSDRQLSLAERKRILLDTAKRRFIEKHGQQ